MLDEWLLHKDRLRRFIVNKTGDHDLADDVLQEVYIKASQNIEQLANKDNFKSWLYRITHNTIMDFYRKSANFEELQDDIAEEVASSEIENLQSMAQCLRPMFNSLPDTYRQVMILSELDGLPQQDVADQVGLSLSATKSRIQRGRVKLKNTLLECCHIEVGGEGIIDYHRRSK